MTLSGGSGGTADAAASKAAEATRVGSNPTFPTTLGTNRIANSYADSLYNVVCILPQLKQLARFFRCEHAGQARHLSPDLFQPLFGTRIF